MKRKLIFFDVDGTIIDHFKNEIPKTTIKALKQLKENNHEVAIASGKGPLAIKNMFDDIEIATFVALNGNYVVYENEIILKNYLDKDYVKAFCEYCISNDIAFTIANEGGSCTVYKNDARVKEYNDEFNNPYPRVIDAIEYDKLFQMSVMIAQEDEAKLIEKFPEFTFVRMSEFGMNIVSAGGLKEIGIQKILDYTDFTQDDLVVFGDGLNDIGMFRLAKTSIAMGNAYQELKDCASIVTDHISENGVYNACKKLKLI